MSTWVCRRFAEWRAKPANKSGTSSFSGPSYGARMFEHRIVSVSARTVNGVVEEAQRALDDMSRDGWELVAATEQAPTSLSLRLFFKKLSSS